MKLQLRWFTSTAGRVQLLTDEDGVPLPGQREVSVRYSRDDVAVIVVEFGVYADEIEITNLTANEGPAVAKQSAVFGSGVFEPGVFR